MLLLSNIIRLMESIILQKLTCSNCAAPLTDLASSYLTCPYCGTEYYAPAHAGYQIPAAIADPHPAGLGSVMLGEQTYRVHGRLGRGRHGDVFLARLERNLTRMVVLKIARGQDEGLALSREWDNLHKVRQQHDFLRHLTPRPVLLSNLAGRLTTVYGWRAGFSFTLTQARSQHPQGVDPKAAVWIWNRMLEQLACLHDAGFCHNALSAEHVLLHPRDHGAAFCGWSEVTRGAGTDLKDSGACIAGLLGTTAPAELRKLALQAGRYDHPLQLKEKLKGVAGELFGPARFHPFTLV